MKAFKPGQRSGLSEPQSGSGCDYIIVGGGSAGCVAAWRLISETDARVVVLEAGDDFRSPFLKLSPGFSRLVPKGIHCTLHRTTPQKNLENRVLEIAVGHVLGGGSSVNAQVYMRGCRGDYEEWGITTGSSVWNWDSLLPHFRNLEDNQRLGGEYHGTDGPLKVSDSGFICEYSRLYVKTVQSLGQPFTADFNCGAPTGTGYLQFTARDGRRCSAVDAFLDRVLGNPRLRVVTRARVSKIVVEQGRAVAVEYWHRGQQKTLRCDAEVLLAAGAFGSPKLLLLSGIGPPEQLRKFQIPVKVELNGVGKNLQDHCGSPVVLRGNSHGYGYFRQDRGWRLVWNMLEYVMFHRGRLTTVGGEATSFHAVESKTGAPTIQIYCVPTLGYANAGGNAVPAVDGIKLHIVLLRPYSRGSVSLRSGNPEEPPMVDPNYLSDPEDLQHLLGGMRIARDIAAAAPLCQALSGELFPGANARTDVELAAYIRRTLRTDWHPVGTCRMGRNDDRMSVVDSHLRVLGLRGLRIIDASTMPNIVSANTNGPTMALADRAMSLLLAAAEVQGLGSKVPIPQAGNTTGT